jgi:hypothetical protein
VHTIFVLLMRSHCTGRVLVVFPVAWSLHDDGVAYSLVWAVVVVHYRMMFRFRLAPGWGRWALSCSPVNGWVCRSGAGRPPRQDPHAVHMPTVHGGW